MVETAFVTHFPIPPTSHLPWVTLLSYCIIDYKPNTRLGHSTIVIANSYKLYSYRNPKFIIVMRKDLSNKYATS